MTRDRLGVVNGASGGVVTSGGGIVTTIVESVGTVAIVEGVTGGGGDAGGTAEDGVGHRVISDSDGVGEVVPGPSGEKDGGANGIGVNGWCVVKVTTDDGRPGPSGSV